MRNCISKRLVSTSRQAALAVTVLAVSLQGGLAAAQTSATAAWQARTTSSPARLLVLPSAAEEVSPALRAQVDEAILHTLAARTRFHSASRSSVPFEDVELAAGCRARDAECMRRISATVGTDWLMIRELTRDASGRVYVSLTAHDGPQADMTRRVVAEVTPSGERGPDRVVPGLVERLYEAELAAPRGPRRAEPIASAKPRTMAERAALASDAAPVAAAATPSAAAAATEPPAAPEPGATSASDAPRSSRAPGRLAATVLGAAATAVGGALLAGGAIAGARSRRDHRSYETTNIEYRADVNRADDLLARSRDRARTANVLLISGAAVATTGVISLLWSRLRARQERRTTDGQGLAFGLAPERAGVAVAVRGAWGGL